MMSAPMMLPARLKRPPVSKVPPSVTARMASSSISSPALLPSALLTFELTSRPATPAARPLNPYTHTLIKRWRTPAMRAAAGLMPMAWTKSPSAVRVSARCSASQTAPATNTANGKPSRKPPPRKKYGA